MSDEARRIAGALAETEALLHAAEQRYHTLFNALDQGLCVVEVLFDERDTPIDYRFIEANPVFAEQTGLHNALGRTARELVPNLEPHWFEVYGRVALTGEPSRFTQGSDAMGRWFDVYAFRLGGDDSRSVAILFNDITQRKRAEDALRASEERYRAFVANSSEGVYRIEFDPPIDTTLPPDEQIARVYRDNRFDECNDAFARMYGFERAEEVVGRDMALMLPPDDEGVREYLRFVIASGYRVSEAESAERDRNGDPVYFANSISGVVEDGHLVRVWGVQRDITQRKLVEEHLRESEQRFRTLAATVPQLIWTAAPDGSVNYLNDQWADYIGLPAERLYDWGWEQVVHPDDLPNTLLHWRRSIESGEPIDVRHRFRYRDGQWRWQLVRGLPIRDEAGQITRWVGTCTDIHEVEQREQDARFLAELGERIRLADDADALLAEVVRLVGAHLGVDRCLLAEVDEQGDVLRVETEYRASPQLAPAAGAYTFASYPQVTAELRAGRTLRSDDMWREPELAAALAARSQNPGEHPLLAVPLLHEGRLRCALVAVAHRARAWEEREVSTLETAAERAWLAAERLRAAAALRESEARLQELYAREQAARAQAEEASRLKDEFLATLSHELRTPLTSILGYAHLLTSRPRDAAYIARALDTIERNARNQAQLIDDLLDVSRIETGKMRLEPQLLDLAPVVEAAVDALRPAIDAKALQLRLDVAAGDHLVVGDPGRLQQVFWNLLSNAVKFTPAGGSIAVELRQLAGQALLAVRDNGQGISPAFLPYVFERFRQAEGASTRANGGLGLGLAIVRHLIEMHGGTVRVHSDGLGAGAAFTVTLPLAAPPAPRDPAYGRPGAEAVGRAADECPPALSGLRVLVVDDQPDILALLEETLRQCGAVVRKHDTARAALAELRDWRPDLLLSDIAMPGEDGYWLIRHVRGLPRDEGGDTLAVALTAYVRPEDRARVLEAGFHHYVPKPVDPGELRQTLAHLVATASRERLPEQALRPDQTAG